MANLDHLQEGGVYPIVCSAFFMNHVEGVIELTWTVQSEAHSENYREKYEKQRNRHEEEASRSERWW